MDKWIKSMGFSLLIKQVFPWFKIQKNNSHYKGHGDIITVIQGFLFKEGICVLISAPVWIAILRGNVHFF